MVDFKSFDVDEIAFDIAPVANEETLHIAIQSFSEGGYDFTVYREDYTELDGGVLDNDDLTIGEAMVEALKLIDVCVDDIENRVRVSETDYENLLLKAERAYINEWACI